MKPQNSTTISFPIFHKSNEKDVLHCAVYNEENRNTALNLQQYTHIVHMHSWNIDFWMCQISEV